MRIRELLFTVSALLAAPAALATPNVVSGNELWIVPSESGWGVNIFHQGDTLFASLFVYGPDGQPRWYTGSDLTPVTGTTNNYSGKLYESTGPWFGGSFNANAVTRREVGTMQVTLAPEVALFRYTIDGVTVDKDIFPFTFDRNDLSGTYTGFEFGWSPSVLDEVNLTVNHSGSSFSMLSTGTALGSCTYTGTHTQIGQMGKVAGTYTCNSGASGLFTFREMDATSFGFTSRFTSSRIPDTINGRLSAARSAGAAPHGVGQMTDLWWVPAESGWGLNVVEQGNTIFATLFVYDESGHPKWYSASNLAFDGDTTWRGALFESTGPYFGTSFNPALVTRRQVGTMSFRNQGREIAQLDYSIDGVHVSKLVNRATFRFNDLAGTYAGEIDVVPPSTSMGGIPTGATSFTVTDEASGTVIRTHAAAGDCTWIGTPLESSQYGQQRVVGGGYSCTNGDSGRFFLSDIEVTYSGFTGALTADAFGIANVAGTRTGPF